MPRAARTPVCRACPRVDGCSAACPTPARSAYTTSRKGTDPRLDGVSYHDVLYIVQRYIDRMDICIAWKGIPMPIELPDLPYPHDALEPVISARTLHTHHGKHHRAYVDKVNALVRGTDLLGRPLEAIVTQSERRAAADATMTALFNNAAQAWNHAFYWRSLRPEGGQGPRGPLAARMRTAFGDAPRFAEALKSAATGHFGSGWAWLVFDGTAVKIVTTSNADTPIVHGQTPLLVIDVWEHAYYLDHQERRAAYVAGVVENLLNWEFAGRNFERAADRANDGGVSREQLATSPASR